MTGYGTATESSNGMNVTIEIRSVNSKFLELNFKIPSRYREREFAIRSECTRLLERGKVDVIMSVESDSEAGSGIDKSLFKDYYKQLSDLQKELNIPQADVMNSILRLPDVVKSDGSLVTDDEMSLIVATLKKAAEKFTNYRKTEGFILENDCTLRVNEILKRIPAIEVYEQERLLEVRKRINGNLEDVIQSLNLDRNRLEQEMIYYIEKLDITEEKVRLKSHCEYFLQVMKDELNNGKKLGFIAQEIGREINTLGAKANHALIQKSVVEMKDELEKLKEQLMNVL